MNRRYDTFQLILILITTVISGYAGENNSEPQKILAWEMVMEAEHAILSNGASVTASSLCSEGRKVSNLGGSLQNGGAAFEFSLPEEGTYRLYIHYLSAEARFFRITLDNDEPESVQTEQTAGWDIPGIMEINISLSAGFHTLMLDNPSGYAPDLDMIILQLRKNPPANTGSYILELSGWKFEVDSCSTLTDIYYEDMMLFDDSYAAFKSGDSVVHSYSMSLLSIETEPISDRIGNGKKLIISSASDNPGLILEQNFYLYEGTAFFLKDIAILSDSLLSSNYMAPVLSAVPVAILPEGTNRAVWIPFDNDKWIRYHALDFGIPLAGYEVTSFYNEDTYEGVVTGSVTHDTWKTGIRATTTGNNNLARFEVFGGVTSSETRDLLPHGTVTGTQISSPKIFIGKYSDWRRGMEQYADVTATFEPQLPWEGKKPFGWNSWGSIQTKLSYTNATESAVFIKDSLQHNHFSNDNTLYIGLDSYWDNISYFDLFKFVNECEERGQNAGIYWSPFVDWAKNPDRAIEGAPGYYYRDIYLYAKGEPQTIAGAYAIDPTHPAAKSRAELYLNRFMNQGFTYIKLDFLVHGALESDAHYDPDVQTGIQAYNQGMQHILETIEGSMFINLSISPLFPARYGHSRRIACDAYAGINETEYTLNSLTYGWWLDHVYSFIDADHVVLNGASLGENRARATSSVITGIFILGDDFSSGGSATAKTKATMFLTNPEVNRVARLSRAFYPVTTPGGSEASDMFVQKVEDSTYLALFNYDYTSKEINVDPEKLGLPADTTLVVHNLWNNSKSEQVGTFTVKVPKTDVALLKLYAGTLTGMDELEPFPAPGDNGTGLYNVIAFPNPCADYLMLAGQTTGNGSLNLKNARGSLVKTFTPYEQPLGLEDLDSGIYFLSGETEDGQQFTLKVIKQQ
ncbi:MAG: T9SS type A sorting domain-containing protein [Bacteroidales bacterium]|nr:T9SS type A sorting domain-containing protein [Bacteroidales bacterium]MBN2698763.1 T9SS type A sorting domain-containing protein [Bacteroidales bacterium]